jgi:hypothetical protein
MGISKKNNNSKDIGKLNCKGIAKLTYFADRYLKFSKNTIFRISAVSVSYTRIMINSKLF